MKTIRIACIIPIPEDPTSYYRGIGPLAALQKSMPNLHFIFPNPINWPMLKLCDMVFMQRPCAPEHFQVLVLAKDLNIPVWIDFDDDNLSVPKDNPTYHQYNQAHMKDAIVKLARYSDVITVSTEALKRKFGIYNKNIFVVPNAFDESLMRIRHLPTTPRAKMLLHRGSPTHGRNLKTVSDTLIKVASKHPDWKFGFAGHDPLEITDNIKNHQIFGGNVFLEYQKMLCQIHASALYYPMAQNDHSQARSHVSWLESTFANMLTIAPKHPEFERPGVLNYTTTDEFESHLENVITGQVDIDKHVEESWKCIQENYLLSKINELRKQVIEQLVP